MAQQNAIGWWLETIGRVPLLTPAQEIELGNRVQRWLNHPDGPEAAPPGIRRSGARAKDQFIAANLRLAVSYVTKHCHRLIRQGHEEDLIQAANLGLIRAVEKFDPTRGYRFSTYAYWWIRQNVNRWIDQQSRTIAIPGSHSQTLARVEGIKRRLAGELLREPTTAEIAQELGIKTAALENMLLRSRSPLSLDQSADDDCSELGVFVGHEETELLEPEEEGLKRQEVELLLTALTPLQRRVVEARYGLAGHPITAQEIAVHERISTRMVERCLREAHNAMERASRGETIKPPPCKPCGEVIQLDLVAVQPIARQPTVRISRRSAPTRPACTQVLQHELRVG